MPYSFNGEKLKKARVYNGFTAVQLASLVGCTDRSIKMYESGKIKNPESEILENLSNHLGFPKDYFFGENSTLKDTPTYFRSLLTTPKKYRDEQIERIEIIATLYSFISEYIEFEKPILPDIDEGTMPEDAAVRLRMLWGIDTKPIEHINFLVEQHGIVVTSFKMSTDKIDAFSRSVDNMHLIGYTNSKDSAARIHFDVAHELGHICLHSGLYEDMESLKEDRDEFKRIENEAHDFASAFLLPKIPFITDVSKDPMNIEHYTWLKRKWKVSIAAMVRRAKNLDVISYEQYQTMMRNMQRRAIRKQEPLDDVLTTSAPSLLIEAVTELLKENVFTPKEFIDELSYTYGLSLYPKMIEDLLNLPKGMLDVEDLKPRHRLRLLK